MKKLSFLCTTVFLLGLMFSPAAAQQGGMDNPHHGRMMQRGGGMGPMCPNCPQRMGGAMGMAGGSMQGEMHAMMEGMGMMRGMGPSFYLDKADRLNLSAEQVQQLREIRRNFKKEAIRRSAELKIAMIDLGDAFQGEWTVEEAEKQLRQIQQHRTDLMVQYLKARKQAEQVLTDEQRQAVRGEMGQDDDM